MEMDIALYEKCSRDNAEKIRKLVGAGLPLCILYVLSRARYTLKIPSLSHQEIEREAAALKWKLIADNATACGIDVDSLL